VRRTIEVVCKLAGVNGRNPHRFRDTFSVSLLQNGVDIRRVSLLLGHTSIQTTERHYAPYVESFQVQLDAATAGLDFGLAAENTRTIPGTLKNPLVSY